MTEKLSRRLYGLSPSEAAIFEMLLSGNAVGRDAIYERLYGDRPDCGEVSERCINVLISKLRKKIGRFGFKITPGHRGGWRLIWPGSTTPPKPSDRLSETERDVFLLLLRRHVVSSEQLYGHLYGHRVVGGPSPATLRVCVSNIRRKLAPLGIVVEPMTEGQWRIGKGRDLALAAEGEVAR